MRKIVASILIIFGASIMIYPKLNHIYKSYKKEKILKQWEKDLKTLEEIKEENLGEVVQKKVNRTRDNSIEEFNKNAAILKIDKINLYMPILEGENEENLSITPSHMKNTGNVGEVGNYAIAGHRSYTYGRHFNRLDEIEEGDKIEVISKGNIYTYNVTNKFIIEPEKLWVLDGNGKDKLITLITCHPIKIATHRLIVQGKLENIEKYSK